MEFTLSETIKNTLEKCSPKGQQRCVMYGHDYRKIRGPNNTVVNFCFCCGKIQEENNVGHQKSLKGYPNEKTN